MKFPAYALQHESKVVWLLHQFRQAYDLWGTPYQGIPNTPDGARIRQIIFNADNLYLNEARRIYTNSEVTGKRLSEFNNISSEILYPPLIAPELYYCDDADDYVFYPSRISPAKRQTLVVEAMQYVRSRTRLVIAGPPDTPDDLRAVKERIEQLSLQHRIELYPYWISDQEKAAFFAKALGCVYIPLDEDSYGYVTLESFEAQKPVVTCTDSGGTRTVVIDGETGWVVEPHPREIAEAIDRLASDRSHARELGAAGLELVRGMGISWDRVVEELLR